jgi:uncharacterized protein DUF1918
VKAQIGDEVVVDSRETGGPVREGEILEILSKGGIVHYRVRWDDGHKTDFFPGSDAHVVRLGSPRKRATLTRPRDSVTCESRTAEPKE